MGNLEIKGVPSTTHRITIRWFDLKREAERKTNIYLHLLWDPSDQSLIGIKIDGLGDFKHINKALFREYCRELTIRLTAKEIDIAYVCDRWIAQRFEPDGFCDQVNSMVLSPLDAAAKLMNIRYRRAE